MVTRRSSGPAQVLDQYCISPARPKRRCEIFNSTAAIARTIRTLQQESWSTISISRARIVYLDQVLTAGGAQTNFLANGLDYTVIEAHDFSHLYQQSLPGSVGVKVVGGPLAAAGNPQTGSVNIYSGLSSNEMLPWDVSGGGKLLVRDVWYEGSPSPAFLHLTGSGTLTMEGLMVAYSLINQSTPTFDINNFKGNATFINDYTSGNWAVSGDGTQARVLGVGLNEITPTTTYFSNNASPAATVGLLQSMNASPTQTLGTAYPTPNTGTLDDAFLRDMFAQTRGEEPHMLADTSGRRDRPAHLPGRGCQFWH